MHKLTDHFDYMHRKRNLQLNILSRLTKWGDLTNNQTFNEPKFIEMKNYLDYYKSEIKYA